MSTLGQIGGQANGEWWSDIDHVFLNMNIWNFTPLMSGYINVLTDYKCSRRTLKIFFRRAKKFKL